MPKRVDKIVVERIVDPDADSSHLGSYSDQPETGAIDRQELGDWERGQFRYFNPANPEYGMADYKRADALNKGEWHYIGIRAVCHFSIGRKGAWTVHALASAGLWGTESDSDTAYLDELGQEQLSELESQLLELGFGPEHIAAAIASAETVNRDALPIGQRYSMRN